MKREPTLSFKLGTQPFGAVYDLEDLVVGEVLYATQVCGIWALHREPPTEGMRVMRVEITGHRPGFFIKADPR